MSAMPQIGDRVRVVGVMQDDPAPMEVGAEGIVTNVFNLRDPEFTQVAVEWENGRTLLLLPSDPFVIIPKEDDDESAEQ